MPRTASPAVRLALIERAASMLARREPVNLRSLVEGTGTSTMAVYTHFGGMPGLWRAVRQEGFVRLGERLERVELTDDPVRDLVALGAAYAANALAEPHLYRAMFDEEAALVDPDAAGRTFSMLVAAAERGRRAGRFAGNCDPEALATRYWVSGHGLLTLVLTGVLPQEALDLHAPAIAVALFVAGGDQEARCRRSVQAGWSTPS